MPRSLSRRRTAPAELDPQDGTRDYDDADETNEEAEQGGGRSGPSRSRTRRAAEDKPARSSSRRRAPVEDDDADDEDDEPRGRKSKRRAPRDEDAPKSSLGSGWDAYKANKAKTSKFNSEDQFKVGEDVEELVAFLEAWPFATYNEHGTGQGKGYRAYVCLGDDCPLCGIGDTPAYRAVFNIAVFDDQGNAAVKYWIATPAPLDEIEAHADNERYAPLNKPGNYFVVSKKKNKKTGFFGFKVERITEAQVADEFNFDPLTADEIEELAGEVFAAKDVVRVKTRKELREVADELED